MAPIFGARRASIGRELTKVHEEFLHGTLAELPEILRARPRIQGEITLVIERGKVASVSAGCPPSIKQHLKAEMQKTGLPRNEALKSIAKQRGISRKQAYNQLNSELMLESLESQKQPAGGRR
jgi:16S rRNA (cytidine1402-2'-O)-methyltransferase